MNADMWNWSRHLLGCTTVMYICVGPFQALTMRMKVGSLVYH